MTDREKLAELYRIYEKPLYHIAMAILHQHEQAEDAVSEAFCKVMRHIPKLNAPDSPETRHYMISVIRSEAINQYRRNARQNTHFTEWNEEATQLADPETAPELRIERTERRQLLQRLLGMLSDTDKRIVLLHCEEGMTFGEIGRRLDMKENAVRKRFERARKRMKAERSG